MKVLKTLGKWYFRFLTLTAFALWISDNSLMIAMKLHPEANGSGGEPKFDFAWKTIIDNYREVVRLVAQK